MTHQRHADDQRRGQLDGLRGADRRGRQQRLRHVLDRRAGAWTYTTNTAHDEFVAGRPTPTARRWRRPTARRTVVTVNILGTNDAAVITGTATAELTETDAAQSTSGTLTTTDVDSSDAFVAQTDVAGSNGYGTFAIDAAGAWTYTMNTAHNEFVAGTTYTDSFTVATADGTTPVITVTSTGTNDAAVITGTHGRADRDQCGAEHQRHADGDRRGQLERLRGADRRGRQQRLRHVLRSTRPAPGPTRWTRPTTSSWPARPTPTASRWRRPTARRQVITVTITGHQRRGGDHRHGDGRADRDQRGAEHQRHADATRRGQLGGLRGADRRGGHNGYGTFCDRRGRRLDLHDEHGPQRVRGGHDYTDSFTVATADGTTQVVTVNITGTNDAAVITGTSTAEPDRDQRGAEHRRHADRQRRGQLEGLRGADQRGRQQRLRQVQRSTRPAPGPTR